MRHHLCLLFLWSPFVVTTASPPGCFRCHLLMDFLFFFVDYGRVVCEPCWPILRILHTYTQASAAEYVVVTLVNQSPRVFISARDRLLNFHPLCFVKMAFHIQTLVGGLCVAVRDKLGATQLMEIVTYGVLG